MGVERSPRLESTKSLTAQNTRSSHRSSSPVNRLATTAKEKDLRTTVLTKQSNRDVSNQVSNSNESIKERLYDSDDNTGDEEEEITQKTKLPSIDHLFKHLRTDNGKPIFQCLFPNCNQVIIVFFIIFISKDTLS